MALSQCHICQCLTNISALRRTSPVTISGHRRETGEQFTQSVYSLALGLRELGVQRGDVIAIAAFNSDWYLEWLLAVAYVGCIAAPLNLRWSFEEARSAMEQVGPIILVVDESCKTWLSSIQLSPVPTLKIAIFLSDLSSSSLINIKVLSQDAMRKPLVGPPSFDYQSAPEDIALICFTSGTTGRPKGVAISHMALIVQSLAKIAIVGYGEDDVYLHTAPLCHIGGISSAVAMLMVASCHVFIPKFDAKAALLAIKEHNVTSFITVPTMMADINTFLSAHGAWGGGTSVKKILNGGGGLSNELMKAAARIFPNATLLSAYGMTEASSSLTFMTLNVEVGSNSHHHKLGGVCVGKPAPHVELLIAGGTDSKSNGHHVGRVLTRGPHLMVKYWGDQATTTSPGSWLDTGDEGYMDESGNLWLMGRVNDRIKSGGENVYPQEVEAILSEHPGITDALVVGLPHPRLTEMVAACVRIQKNWRWEGQNSYYFDFSKDQLLSQEMLQNYCRQRILTGFKIPKMFILWHKPFPVTTTGKPRRDEIRREVISHLQLLPSNL